MVKSLKKEIDPIGSAKSEPPALKHFSNIEIASFLDSPLQNSFPLDTVAVERAVKDVSKASRQATNTQERNGVAHLTIHCRRSGKQGSSKA